MFVAHGFLILLYRCFGFQQCVCCVSWFLAVKSFSILLMRLMRIVKCDIFGASEKEAFMVELNFLSSQSMKAFFSKRRSHYQNLVCICCGTGGGWLRKLR